jgi:hypothetical protein
LWFVLPILFRNQLRSEADKTESVRKAESVLVAKKAEHQARLEAQDREHAAQVLALIFVFNCPQN